MLGRTHVLSGAAAFHAVTMVPALDMHPSLAARAAYTAVAAGAASLCDLDSCGATASRSFGWASEIVARCVGWVSRGHREGTHSVVGVAAFTGYTVITLAALTRPPALPHLPTWTVRDAAGVLLAGILAFIGAAALEALRLARRNTADTLAAGAAAAVVIFHSHLTGLAGIPVAVAVGVAAHIAGDMLTTHGCPLAWPWSERRYHLMPRCLQFTTGTWPERVIAVALIVVNLWFTLSAAGLTILTTRR